MDPQLRSRAEARLEAAAAELGLSDPRPAYRTRLRMLRETDSAAFDQAIAHYESVVLDALATGDDPIRSWLDYGNFLAGLSGPAQLHVIDASGRAAPFEPPLPPGSLALFIPEDAATAPLVAATPSEPSRAQQATLDLLLPG